ncbi:hypothetical protein LCI18_014815 [Fusarium solani-melongenae]|uniref:Uncharacterized protein n=1 Tax=Fusarium solani subsp. cucurbitae TaxID=2747967 RepID=A0ACD3ZRN1_FUSSC|nr:hypothetical protein LCI18_014815 [Fusarium solani-melongenae]
MSTTSAAQPGIQDDATSTSAAANNRKPPRRLLPQSFREEAPRQTLKKAKHEKSRHGCVTCKAKRRKCDELKPSCSQCLRRRVPCGGYSLELIWKEIEKPDQTSYYARKTTKTRHLQTANSHQTTSYDGPQERTSSQLPSSRISEDPESNTMEVVASPRPQDDDILQAFDSPTAPSLGISFSPTEQVADFDMLFLDLNAIVDPKANVTEESTEAVLPNFLDLASENLGAPDILSDQDPDVLDSTEDSWISALNLAVSPSLQLNGHGLFNLYRQPAIRDNSPESIAMLYDNRICEILYIKEDPTGNPWRKVVWPLAKDHPALYHAIAAMTCFNGAKCLPRLRAEGVRHLENSMGKLSVEANGSMRLEVALIITLALSIAQTWYYPRASNGISHINKAKDLLQQGLSKDLASRPLEGNLRLSFLANLWLYMDVLTRITCSNVQAMDLDLMTACSSTSPCPESQVDPLMGCAGALFPLIGRVADLVRRVRKTQDKLNSPVVVARAVELKMAIECWTPSMSLEVAGDVESLTPNASDLVQTANSYKWATLLLLYQAVPELPIRFSFSEMARKVLVLIATVPLHSRAVIFHILPLMIAGCEATEAEDRDWIRDRWKSMTTGNSSGIVDRCLELTLEVWRRRDSYGKHRQSCEGSRTDNSLFSAGLRDVGLDFEQGMVPESGFESDCACMQHEWEPLTSFLLFDSTPLTQQDASGLKTDARNYTVKSRLHWLTVMEEWGWEVMLG